MAKITGLPDLGHDWKPVRVDGGPFWYECRCLLRSPVPYRDSFCPNAVLDYVNRLVAETRKQVGRELAAFGGELVKHSRDSTVAGMGVTGMALSDIGSRLMSGLPVDGDPPGVVDAEALTTLPGSDR